MEEKKKNPTLPWKVVSGILVVALIVMSVLYFSGVGMNNKAQSSAEPTMVSESSSNNAQDALSLWTESAPLKAELTSYMKTITDESSKDFIPVESRIAVFDMDGTLSCETDPGYFDHKRCITV